MKATILDAWRFSFRWMSHAVTAALFVASCAPGARAGSELLYSFENGLQGWVGSGGVADPNHSVSAFGATDGTMALNINIPTGYSNNIGYTGDIGPGTDATRYNIIQRAAQEAALGHQPRFQFDWTIDTSAATGLPAYAQLAMFMNSTGGYTNYGTSQLIGGNVGTDFPRLDPLAESHGATLKSIGPNAYRVSVPMLTLAQVTGGNKGISLDPASHYFQIGFQRQGGFGGTLKYGIDNIRFTGIPTFTSHTLFSWETPDDLGTPSVNEAFEGWVTRNELPSPPMGVTLQEGHSQAIVTTGATSGTKAYQIDRTSLTDGFTWGSVYGLSGAGNPANQTKVNELITRVNNAERIAFDVTYRRDFPAHDPSFTNFYIHFADGTGNFYQGSSASIDPAHAPAGVDVTTTLEIPFSAFVSKPDGTNKSLLNDGLSLGATYFEIGIASNTDDGQVYQIDNLRLLSPAYDADFNDNGAVNGDDLAIWKQNFGTGATGDANEDGVSDGRDFLVWQREFGAGQPLGGATTVPEPACWMLAATLALALSRASRRAI
jgi:hypothetical protein